MAYERDLAKFLSLKAAGENLTASHLTYDMCCDGCPRRCKLSIRLKVSAEQLDSRHKYRHKYFLKPEVYVGNVNLGGFKQEVKSKSGEGFASIDISDADAEQVFKDALGLCRKTCKHSIMR